MKEMEKKDGKLIFLKEKLSLFIQVLGMPQSCVCVRIGRCAVDRYITEYRHGAARDLVTP